MKCLDTYALVEIHNGNQRFAGLLNDEIVITNMTMAEFYAFLYRKYNLQTAEYWHRKLSFFCKPVPMPVLLKAVKFRIDNKTKNFSFFDCVGYTYARENNMKFVTGDRQFHSIEGVEFVK